MSESLLRATEEEKLEILNKYSAFVFDLDGTLWKGTDLVPGAAEVLELLRYQVDPDPPSTRIMDTWTTCLMDNLLIYAGEEGLLCHE